MKKKGKLIAGLLMTGLLMGMSSVCAQAAGEVAIDSTHFPDDTFRTYVSNNCDTNKDGSLSADEISAVKGIYVYNKGITSLTGIEYFTELAYLECNKNSLSTIDVSRNTKLENIDCGSNQLTTLDVSQNTMLTNLDCYYNQIQELDVTNNPNLINIGCYNNHILSLDLKNNTKLQYLTCWENSISSIDFSNNTSLVDIDISRNQLTQIDISNLENLEFFDIRYNNLSDVDVSHNKKLISLDIYGNEKLSKIDLGNNTELQNLYCGSTAMTTLDVSRNTKLTKLGVYNSGIEKLDVSKNVELVELSCSQNKLTQIDVSKNTKLQEFSCYENQLTTLDVSKNQELTSISCEDNNLTQLDVSHNPKLIYLYCGNNQLRSIDISKNPELIYLSCYENQLTSIDIGNNSKLSSVMAYDNVCEVMRNIDDTIDLTSLPGTFDINRASNWTGCTMDGNIITVTDSKGIVTYDYDIGIKNINFRLETIPHEHSYDDQWKYDEKSHWKVCSCGETSNIAVHSNIKERVVKASLNADGKIVRTCGICNCVTETVSISKVASIRLSKTSYTYNGKVKKPSVTVKDSKGNILKNKVDYTVSYGSGRKNVGKYRVVIKLQGKYNGTITKTFTIKPKSTSLISVSGISKGLKVKWKKQGKQVTGYQIQYSTSSKFKNGKKIRISKSKTTIRTIKNLKAKKRYYVRIRTYKTVKVNGKKVNIYSDWSKKNKRAVTKRSS